jgi:CBS domain-containing protein/gamma-glutamyl:cysteine ligase YbdK (ATP-grasp superfamily)
MGDHNVASGQDDQQALEFMKSLLADLSALERLLETGRIESAVRRIGAEQEMFLVDRFMRPAPLAAEVLEKVDDPRLTTEIGKFNLEANLSPQRFAGSCLRDMEKEVEEVVELARNGAQAFGADIVLTGILPTLNQADLSLDNLSANPRYAELNRALNHLRGNRYQVHIKGLDSLHLTHDNMMLEACCTSFQVHLQVSAEEFVQRYNWAQAITAPLMAAATNSPLLLGYRLWHETRIALFQHSVDERSKARYMRGHPARVTFGNQWLKGSILELFREQIARFRVILTKKIDEDPLAVLEKGDLPQLLALRLHNGTVWRWNRPCYGISDGQAHLRIENRVIPSGPTTLDEMANAAFFLGLMEALPMAFGEVNQSMAFDCAKENFFAAARHGLNAQFSWLEERRLSASELIVDHLLPLAHEGLKQAGVPSQDRNRYLGTIQERVLRNQNGSLWALRSIAGMQDQGTREQRHKALVSSMLEQQKGGLPIHDWELAKLSGYHDWLNSFRTVGQFMTTDLFTLRPDDLIDLAASMMDWRHIRHIPVEDNEGHLIGLVSHRDLLKGLLQRAKGKNSGPVVVKDIMKPNPITTNSQTTTLEAIELMKSRRVGCLPVVEANQLVGIITAYDFLLLSGELIKQVFSEPAGASPGLPQSLMNQA